MHIEREDVLIMTDREQRILADDTHERVVVDVERETLTVAVLHHHQVLERVTGCLSF